MHKAESIMLKDHLQFTPLLRACRFGKQESVKQLLLNDQVDVNAVGEGIHTALHIACAKGYQNAQATSIE